MLKTTCCKGGRGKENIKDWQYPAKELYDQCFKISLAIYLTDAGFKTVNFIRNFSVLYLWLIVLSGW